MLILIIRFWHNIWISCSHCKCIMLCPDATETRLNVQQRLVWFVVPMMRIPNFHADVCLSICLLVCLLVYLAVCVCSSVCLLGMHVLPALVCSSTVKTCLWCLCPTRTAWAGGNRAKFFNCNNYTAISRMFNNAAMRGSRYNF